MEAFIKEKIYSVSISLLVAAVGICAQTPTATLSGVMRDEQKGGIPGATVKVRHIFRGDTIHPSTLELLHELGILEEFLRLPHQRMQQLKVTINDAEVVALDFSRLSTRCKYTALMPQWDFLNFIAAQAKRCADFQLLMQDEAIGQFG